MKYLVLDDEILAAEYLAALICEVDEKAEVVMHNRLIYAFLHSDPAIQSPVLWFLTLTFTIPPLLYFPPVFLLSY